MDGIYIIFGLAILVFLALVAMLIIILISGNQESQSIHAPEEIVVNEMKNQTQQHNPQKTAVTDRLRTEELKVKPRRRQKTSWQSSFVFLSISLVITLWTIWGALFFLALVWILRQNPAADASSTVTEHEKSLARRIYVWLLFSPMLTLPIFVGMLFNVDFPEADTYTRSLVTMIPLIFHVPLLMGLNSKSAFVYRHTQQAILLVALWAGTATLAISVGAYPIDGIWLFLLGNGSLWLLGSLWGLDQVSRGECWLMEQKGETRAIKTEKIGDLRTQIHLEQSREPIERYNVAEAKKHALAAFRSGDREVRFQAVKLLSALHEVEEF